MKNIFIVLTFLFFTCTVLVHAEPNPIYSFDSLAQEQRFIILTTESRCLVCQNQSLADSDAPLAVDLRKIIYTRIKQGDDDKKIQDFLVQRYGDYVLLRPPLNKNTWVLWTLPFALLFVGFGMLIYYVRRRI
jgi:cytochrome c-type biogenesis protein CcmH